MAYCTVPMCSLSPQQYLHIASVFCISQFYHYPPPADEGRANCFDTKVKPNPLHFYSDYSYSACMVECKTAYVIKKCGCREMLQPGIL